MWIYNVFGTRLVFSMRVFVFLASGIVEKGAGSFFLNEFTVFLRPEFIFQWESLFLWCKLIENFNESVCFFGLRPIENWFFNESICFFGLRPIENWFFNESLCFFGLRLIENCFFNESVRFWVFFNESLCFFGVSGLLKIDFLMKIFFFWFQALWKTVLCLFFYMNLKCF